MKIPLHFFSRLSLSLLTGGCIVGSTTAAAAQKIRVPTSGRWLEVREVKGTVTYHNQQRRPVKVGDRLQAVGDGIKTGSRSSAILAVDGGGGKVEVAPETSLVVGELSVRSDGGKDTILSVTRGQATLQVTPSNKSKSRFAVRTPAGIAGVRGTVFGISVDPNGKTGISTLQGSVEAIGQNQTTPVDSGQSALLIPGKAPLAPRLTSVKLKMRTYSLARTSLGTVEVVGKIDPLNTVFLNGKAIETDPDGNFKLQLRRWGWLRFLVRSPLGYQRVYEYGVR